jgi:hypothetical protein
MIASGARLSNGPPTGNLKGKHRADRCGAAERLPSLYRFCQRVGGVQQSLGDKVCENLRWYPEDWLVAPFTVYEERGHSIEAQFRTRGEVLFEAALGPGEPSHIPYIGDEEGERPSRP